MGNANTKKESSMRQNEIKPAEKTPEELQKERELEAQKREEYYKKNAIEIQIHKEMLLQRALNKDFKIKLPIAKIQNFPVDVYLVFTHLSQYDAHRQYYRFELQIFQKDSLSKILYAEKLPREYLITFFNVSDYYDNLFNVSDYYDNQNCSGLWLLSMQLSTIYSIIKDLNKDTYMECFTKDKIRQTIIVDYTEYNVDLEFCTIYNCKTCGGQMKANTETCYFCRQIKSVCSPEEIYMSST